MSDKLTVPADEYEAVRFAIKEAGYSATEHSDSAEAWAAHEASLRSLLARLTLEGAVSVIREFEVTPELRDAIARQFPDIAGPGSNACPT